jgi:hypothetical protein
MRSAELTPPDTTPAAEAKGWSVPPMVLADLRPAAVQVFHLQSALEPRIAKVETEAVADRAAAVATNATNAATMGALLHAQASEAKRRGTHSNGALKS